MKKLHLKTALPPRHDIPSFWRGDATGKIFLHLGENPFPPSPRVRVAIAKASQHANRYPDTNALGCGKNWRNMPGMAWRRTILSSATDRTS